MADDLHIHQLVRGDAAQPSRRVHRKAALLVHQVDVQRLFEFQGEIVVAHRLDQKADRVHLIALQGVLYQAGDENNRYVFVVPAQLHGGVHAVFPGHLDVQEHHRVDGFVVLKKSLAITEPGDAELLAKLGGVPLYVCRQMLGGGIFVLHNGNVFHSVLLLYPSPSGAPSGKRVFPLHAVYWSRSMGISFARSVGAAPCQRGSRARIRSSGPPHIRFWSASKNRPASLPPEVSRQNSLLPCTNLCRISRSSER